MKKLGILLAVVACASAPVTRPDGQAGVLVAGANIDAVRDAIVSHVTDGGYSVLSASENLVTAEMPARDNPSGYYFLHQEYVLWSVPNGVRIRGVGRFIDKTPPALKT